jgi:hypothetical protein
LLATFQGIKEEALVSSEPDWDSDFEEGSEEENSILGDSDVQFERRMVDTIDLWDDDTPDLSLP